jgi:hypothetical protein
MVQHVPLIMKVLERHAGAPMAVRHGMGALRNIVVQPASKEPLMEVNRRGVGGGECRIRCFRECIAQPGARGCTGCVGVGVWGIPHRMFQGVHRTAWCKGLHRDWSRPARGAVLRRCLGGIELFPIPALCSLPLATYWHRGTP